MRKRAMSIGEAKQLISAYVGIPVCLFVNKGRKRIVRYEGEVTELYPAVFTVKIVGEKNMDMMSCTYSDVICGDLRIQPL